MTKVKICGITNPEDLEAALKAGADYVGIVREPSSPRYVDNPEPLIQQAAGRAAVLAVYGQFFVDPYVQLFDAIQTISDVSIANLLRVVRLGEPGVGNPVDSVHGPLLLDAYHKDAYGGTGSRVEWNLAADIVRQHDKPVFLAGGLTPENVAEAVSQVRPYALDVSSGVETSPGTKDHAKVAAFVTAVRSVQD
jgi:phosphoribosylanthranilate isomerase